MGPHRAAGLIAFLMLASPAVAEVPGWQFSRLEGEGDRAAMGCARGATRDAYACLAVRCEDDFTIGVYVHSSRFGGDEGRWEMTVDRENRSVEAVVSGGPYGARIAADADWLLDRVRHGTFVYLRHIEDEHLAFSFIDLTGSMATIAEALYWCAPRSKPGEQNMDLDVVPNPSQTGETR